MIEPNLSLDGPRVPWIGAPPESWDDVVWPEWVPRSVVDEVQSFWSDLGGPKAYRRAAHDNYFDAPPLGYTGWLYSGRHPKAVDGLISGRYVFAWGNMGRVVLDDGTVAVVSGEAQYRKVLLLRTCACDGQSHRGFMWPLTVGAEVVAPDWDPSPECGRGLHGLLWGEGMPTGAWHWEADAKWLVVEAREIDLIDLGRKYKFPRCTIRHVGDRASATEFIGKRAPPSAAIVGGVRIDRSDREVRSGDHGVVVGGPLGYLVSGRSGRSLGGFRSACISRDFGVSVAGDNGHCCAGSDGLSLTGEEGTSTSLNRGTSVTGAFGVSASGLHGVSVGGNHARSHSGTFGTSIAGHSGQGLSMDQGISRTGAGGTSISGHSGISVSGDNGRSISGDGGHSITGRDGCCSAGINGTISIEHGSGGRRVVGCIGIDLKPNVMYKLVGESFVEDSYKRNPAQEIADATVSTYILLEADLRKKTLPEGFVLVEDDNGFYVVLAEPDDDSGRGRRRTAEEAIALAHAHNSRVLDAAVDALPKTLEMHLDSNGQRTISARASQGGRGEARRTLDRDDQHHRRLDQRHERHLDVVRGLAEGVAEAVREHARSEVLHHQFLAYVAQSHAGPEVGPDSYADCPCEMWRFDKITGMFEPRTDDVEESESP